MKHYSHISSHISSCMVPHVAFGLKSRLFITKPFACKKREGWSKSVWGTTFSYWVLEVGWGASKSKWRGEPDFGSVSGWQVFFWQTLNILSVICNLLSPFLQIHSISSIYLQKLFWFSSNFWKLFSLLQDHCGLGCTFENIPSAANSHGILLFSDLLMMQFSKCIFHSDRLHLYSSDFISAVFWFPSWQNFHFYLQILWQSPELILIGSYFTKAPLSQIQLRFSVGLKTAERQFMTFASPPFNRWDIWGKHQDIALSEGIQKKSRKQKFIEILIELAPR